MKTTMTEERQKKMVIATQLRRVNHLAISERDKHAIAALTGFCDISRSPEGPALMYREKTTMTIGKDGAVLTLVTPQWRIVYSAPAGTFRRAFAGEFKPVSDGVYDLYYGLWELLGCEDFAAMRFDARELAQDTKMVPVHATAVAFHSSVEICNPLHKIKVESFVAKEQVQ